MAIKYYQRAKLKMVADSILVHTIVIYLDNFKIWRIFKGETNKIFTFFLAQNKINSFEVEQNNNTTKYIIRKDDSRPRQS